MYFVFCTSYENSYGLSYEKDGEFLNLELLLVYSTIFFFNKGNIMLLSRGY